MSKRVEKRKSEGLSEPWRFVLAGLIAIAAGPILRELSGTEGMMFTALSFGAALGALDTLGVKDGLEVAARAAVGLALGGLLGIALVVFESLPLFALTLGGGVILSRWIWMVDQKSTALVSVFSAAVIAMGAMVLFTVVDPWRGEGIFVTLHPFYWGVFSALGAVLFAEAPKSIRARKGLPG